jgi:hypothetical protein
MENSTATGWDNPFGPLPVPPDLDRAAAHSRLPGHDIEAKIG